MNVPVAVDKVRCVAFGLETVRDVLSNVANGVSSFLGSDFARSDNGCR